MQVWVNGKPVAELPSKIERRLIPKRGPDVAEGAVLGAEQSTAAVSGRLRLVYGVACGVGGAIAIAALVGAASYEPRDLVVVLPVFLVLAAGLAWLVGFVYRRNMAKQRLRADAQLPRMAPVGTSIRADAAGLTIGGALHAWPDLVVDVVEITDTVANEDSVSWVERLELTGAGRVVVLDAVLIGNGRVLVDKVWRELRNRSSTA